LAVLRFVRSAGGEGRDPAARLRLRARAPGLPGRLRPRPELTASMPARKKAARGRPSPWRFEVRQWPSAVSSTSSPTSLTSLPTPATVWQAARKLDENASSSKLSTKRFMGNLRVGIAGPTLKRSSLTLGPKLNLLKQHSALRLAWV